MRADLPRAAWFPLAAVGWSLGLFGFLRSPWVERGFVVPITQFQQRAAEFYAGPPSASISVTAECSGTDVLALCLAAILAWPVSWRARLKGAAGGIAFVLVLNTLRIATLGQAAASPALFQTLHLQIWPAILVLATSSYVFAWMRSAMTAGRKTGEDKDDALSSILRRFAPRAAVLLVAFAFCGPWIAGSEALLEAGAWTARAGALLLTTLGVAATVSGNVLTTSRGAFMVTPECLATALFPLYVAGVFTVRLTWPWRALALAAAPPLFAALAIARLLLLALPQVLAASPLFLVHGFHQLVLAVMGVVLLAVWSEPQAPRRFSQVAKRTAVALGSAVILAVVAGPALTNVVLGAARTLTSLSLMEMTGPGDAQGALALLPAFQAGLLLALGLTASAGWRPLLSAFGVLLVSQIVFLVVLGEIAERTGWAPHALALRAWAVAVPVVLTLIILRAARPRRTRPAPLHLVADGSP